MATQRDDDHLNRRIPESKAEGTFDRDLHRTLDLTVRQVNELEEKVDRVAGRAGGGGAGERLAELEEKLSSFGDKLSGVEDRLEQIEFEARDEVFLEPIRLRAGKSFVGGTAGGEHTVVFNEDRSPSQKALTFLSKGPDAQTTASVTPQGTVFGRDTESAPRGARAEVDVRGGMSVTDGIRFRGSGEKRYADVWAGSGGTLHMAPKAPDPAFPGPAPADVELHADQVLPHRPYETSLGSQQKKYQSAHAAELWVDQLVAQKKIATIGGSVFVGPTTELTQPLSGDPGDAHRRPPKDYYNYIRVKHNQMSPGDVVLMDNFTRAEFLRIESEPTEIEAVREEEGGSNSPFNFTREHNYRYRVERDLDGTGANNWGEGAAVANTGRKASGFIDLYATRSQRSENESGPSMAISEREEDKSFWDITQNRKVRKRLGRNPLSRRVPTMNSDDSSHFRLVAPLKVRYVRPACAAKLRSPSRRQEKVRSREPGVLTALVRSSSP